MDVSAAAPVVSIVGRSGSGKTTLIEKLIGELTQRGYRLAVIKHHHHRGIQFDEPGKDTWRFRQAGADHVVLAGPDQVVHLRYSTPEPALEEIASTIRGVDLILTEGYKRAHTPRIEVVRGADEPELVCDPSELVAVVSDRPRELDTLQFGLDEVRRLADFIQGRFLRRTG